MSLLAESILAEPLVSTFIRSFLALLFVTAAVSKLRHREEFFGVVRNFRLTPEWLDAPIAAALPIVELAVAAGLMIPAVVPFAAPTAAGLLVAFGFAIGINVWRGRTAIDCGCLRDGMKQPLSWLLVARNATLALLALGASFAAPMARAAEPLDLGLGIAAAALAMLLYVSASLLTGLQNAVRVDQAQYSKG